MAAVWTTLGDRSKRSVQLLTESAPAPGDPGVWLSDVGSILPVVRLEGAATFLGTGTLLGYLYVAALARWVRAPRTDLDLSDVAGLHEVALPALPVTSPRDLFIFVASGVGASGGTTVTIDYLCSTIKGDLA